MELQEPPPAVANVSLAHRKLVCFLRFLVGCLTLQCHTAVRLERRCRQEKEAGGSEEGQECKSIEEPEEFWYKLSAAYPGQR